VPIIIGIGGLILGVVLMLWAMASYRPFFGRKPEVADARALDDAEVAAVESISVAP
jgi:hypothetical protein